MKYTLEVPFAYMRKYRDIFPYDFCLTHLAESSEDYLNFFKEQASRGRYCILDNSAFELREPVSPERILRIQRQLNPSTTVVVSPDVFRNGPKTLEAIRNFIAEAKGARTMAVVTGATLEEWFQCYKEITEMPEIEIIGIPYELPLFFPENYLENESKTRKLVKTRVELLRRLESQKTLLSLKPIHLLGTSDPTEVFYVKHISQIKSVDTSTPFVQALCDKTLKVTGFDLTEEKEKRPSNYFSLEYNQQTDLLALQNIATLANWCTHG